MEQRGALEKEIEDLRTKVADMSCEIEVRDLTIEDYRVADKVKDEQIHRLLTDTRDSVFFRQIIEHLIQ